MKMRISSIQMAASRHLLILLCALAFVALVVGISACSPSTTAKDDGGGGALVSRDNAHASSILANPSHSDGIFTEENITSPATCTQSACHTPEELVNDGAGLLVDLDSGTVSNPHSNHQYLQCTDCHSVSDQSTLYCNSCHEFTLSDGWSNPEMDAAELGYEFDVSNSDLPSYADSGRDVESVPEEVLNGQGQMAENPGLMDQIMKHFMEMMQVGA